MANSRVSNKRRSGGKAPKRSSSKKSSASAPRGRISALREELEKAAAGLNYSSESDYPFRFFTLPAEDETDLTPQGFLNRIGVSQQFIDEVNLPIDRLVEERTLDGFFPTDDDLADYHGTDASDPKIVSESKRFRELEAVLRKRLRGVKVLRVGQVEIRCYIAGLDEHGDIAGLVTTAIET
jgi:Nuclease A inhibitor-like protein